MLSPKWKTRLYGIGALTFTTLGIGLLYVTVTGPPPQPPMADGDSQSTERPPTQRTPAQHPLQGESAPDFSLEQMNGEPFRLSDHRGEIVVVNFWATWCPPCRKEIPGFIQLQKEFGTEEVTILGISLDDQGFEAVRPYAEEMGINYPLVVGSNRLTRKYGGVRALPTSFVVGPEGTVQYARPGFLPKAELRRQLKPLLKRVEPSS
ncbi:TlpA family protein disulfide reductase [Salinibacter ruber]|uniref:TlpA family protein disulfide reductase n=1 Tax=Salinibacter ruber TaxID=146919 RepID=UPI000E584830|nr:TlpA disulfide reductase family protein [Salinibacter ruber]